MNPSEFPQFRHGDGRRFHVRSLDDAWQVYGLGLRHVCTCSTGEAARMIADALDLSANFDDPPTATGLQPDASYFDLRD
jgi:hypothetical protein